MPKKRTLTYIAVDGPIGSGKTTLTKMLSEDMNGTTLFEPVDANPFLPDFYKDRKRNAFKTQLFFLLNRYQQQLELKQEGRLKAPVICDYTFAKDLIFARLNLSPDELKLYETIYDMLVAQIKKPDLVIYLKA
ncbi:MAG: deoxynucleoside kinase, partial [Deltaproteobacteria bacterium]|nr:deoxynucleoside kinase [Deltaproteobacteria bacterium]